MRLENKIALVTGGGQGIGKEIAKTLALNGAFVLINYIDLGNNQEIAQMTKNEIESLGGKCEILPANVASYDETLEMFKTIKNEYGRLDILINNAGITKDGEKYNFIEDYSVRNAQKNYSSDISCTNSSNVRPKAVAIAVTVRSDGLLRSRSNKLI